MLADKRGYEVGEQLGIFFFLFLIVIIGVSIFVGVGLFFGKGYDFREVEAELLNYKIRECLAGNEIGIGFFEKENFYNKCRIDRGVVDSGNYIIKICEGNDENNCFISEGIFSEGSNFQACKLNIKKNYASPLCSIKTFEKNGKSFVIVTGSKQDSRRLRE